MPRPVIPEDRQGYMLSGGELHTRYATHVARGPRMRSIDEAWGAVARIDYRICETCYPPAVKAPKVPRPRATPRTTRPRARA